MSSEPPQIIHITPAIPVSINESVQLECAVFGIPSPSVVWMHNAQYLQGENTESDNVVKSVLSLLMVQVNDMGLYNCIANNTGGEDRASTSVTVKGEQCFAMLHITLCGYLQLHQLWTSQ